MIRVRYRKGVYALLLGEIICFVIIAYQSTHGFAAIKQLRQENNAKRQELVSLRDEVDVLKDQVNAWKTDPFYKEKAAREQLQMARSGDVIYYLT